MPRFPPFPSPLRCACVSAYVCVCVGLHVEEVLVADGFAQVGHVGQAWKHHAQPHGARGLAVAEQQGVYEGAGGGGLWGWRGWGEGEGGGEGEGVTRRGKKKG